MCPRTDRASGSFGVRGASVRRSGAFTLVELLVSMAVLVLVMVVTAQLVGKASSITSASNKQVDASSMARIALDRFGSDFATAALNSGTTALYYTELSGALPKETENSSLGFICKTRARKMASAPDAVQDVRGIIVGYKVRPTATILRGGASVNVPLMNRGDAEFTFSVNGSVPGTGSSTDKYGFSVWNMFGTGDGSSNFPSLPTDLSTANDTSLLTWQGIGDGVLRLHISFVLNDGTIVQVPQALPALDATYNGFKTTVNGGVGNCLPIAFSAATSADPTKRFVTGMIVGIVVLDQASLNLGYATDNNYAAKLAGEIKRPMNIGETPLRIWQANQTSISLPAVRQNIRFYQRFYSVNP